jgi:DNA (cytosine-5)-methyltransferase 1
VTAFYNEWEEFPASRLRRLIDRGRITPGTVDTRSITEVTGDDIKGYNRCHLFAGIAGWELALRIAGWGADPVWTGSCPCQDFSVGNQDAPGIGGERDLWPDMYRIIGECRPPVVFGEQVDAAITVGWMDRLQADMEAIGYAVGFKVLPACSVGTTHIRQRIYWVASDTGSIRIKGQGAAGSAGEVRPGRPYSPMDLQSILDGPYSGRDGLPQPLLRSVSDGLPDGLAGMIKAVGNAIVPGIAAEFIRSFMEATS